jgi:hypothetical protein
MLFYQRVKCPRNFPIIHFWECMFKKLGGSWLYLDLKNMPLFLPTNGVNGSAVGKLRIWV